MIIGIITRTGTTKEITCNCPKCGQNEEFIFQFTTKFFHFFRLRCFPINNLEICQCLNCKTIYNASNFTNEMRAIKQKSKALQKKSFFDYLGLVAILLIILCFNLPQSASEKKRIKELNASVQKEFVQNIQHPKNNDVYYLQKKDTLINNQKFSPTSFLIVKKVTKDSLIFNLCKYEELAEKKGNIIIKEGFKEQYYNSENQYNNKIAIERNQILKDTTIFNLRIYEIKRKKVVE